MKKLLSLIALGAALSFNAMAQTAAPAAAAPAAAPAAAAPAKAPTAAPPPLTGGKLVIGTIALSLATFMNVLDSSIANVSIPAISGDLGGGNPTPSEGWRVWQKRGAARPALVISPQALRLGGQG